MKQVFIIILLLGYSLASVAQNGSQSNSASAAAAPVLNFPQRADSLRKAMIAMAGSDSTAIKHAIKKYNRWETFWTSHNSSTKPDSISDGAAIKSMLYSFFGLNPFCTEADYPGDWRYLGPENDYYNQSADHQGRIISLWVKPTDTNYILAGAAAGGLFKSTDGGKNWFNTTDLDGDLLPGTMGIADIAVNPLNNNEIYISTGTFISATIFTYWGSTYSLGLLHSVSGGSGWVKDAQFENLAGGGAITDPDWVRKIAYRPATQKLYAIFGSRVFYKPSSSQSWQELVIPASIALDNGQHFTDFEFSRLANNVTIFSTNNSLNTGKQYLYFYNESTQQWSRKTIILPANFINNNDGYNEWGIQELTITSADTAYMRLFLYNTSVSANRHILAKTNIGTSGATIVINPYLESYETSSYRTPNKIFVSDSSPNTIYLTDCGGHDYNVLRRSTDGGVSFPVSLGAVHADGRALLVYKQSSNPLNDVIFMGTDGGVAKKRLGSSSLVSLSGKGLNIAQFYEMQSNPADDGQLLAGAQDNGTFTYNRSNTTVPWHLAAVGDGFSSAFANNGERAAYTKINDNLYTLGFNNPIPSPSSINLPYADLSPGYNHVLPIRFDAKNIARAGYHYIWRKALNDNSWSQNFSNDPAQKPLGNDLLTEKKSLDFIIHPMDSNVVYAAYGGAIWDQSHLGNYDYAKLVRKDPSDPTWIDVSPSEIVSFNITDIETDPLHPNRIWVSFGGFDWEQRNTPHSSMQKRVKYSDNYGDTWQDVSHGLLPLPVTKLLYIPGSDDVIFAATDVGVYRWNKAKQQWECFDNGMPKCIVSDIEYNACSGMLRVSTYGRGIWESPWREDVNTYVPGDAIVINANTTWSSSKTVDGSVRVKSGRTLTISGATTTIFMPRKARILVEAGATIVVDHARITNDCDGREWQGIELWGNVNQPPGSAQGRAVMKNHAVIENAAIGIVDYTWDNGAVGGGRMDIQNTTFLNCRRGVGLNYYPNYPGVVSRIFKNDTFLVNSNRMYQAAPQLTTLDMFSMWNTNTITIDSCTFRDDRSLNMHSDSLITGIYTIDARYTVSNSSFTHMRRGVCADNTILESVRGVTVINNKFNNVREGVTGTATNPLIADNTFSVLHPELGPVMPKRKSWAVYLTFARSAAVLRNNIGGSKSLVLNTQDNFYKYGIVLKGAGNNSALIQSNQLTNLNSGFQAEYSNGNTNVSCNNFRHNTYAMTINPQSTSPAYHFCSQGYCAAPAPPPFTSLSSYPNNVFDGNSGDISSFTPNSWSYVIKSGGSASYVPLNNYGSVNVNSCTSSTTVFLSCSKNIRLGPKYTIASIQPLLAEWQSSLTAANRYSDSMMILYQAIVKGFTGMDSAAPLQNFLEADTTDESRILLLPFYLQQRNMTKLTNTVNATSLPTADKQAYLQYYTIMNTVLSTPGNTVWNIDSSQRVQLEDIAKEDYDVTPAVKSLLAFVFDEPWEREPEDIPEMHARPAPPEEQNAYVSQMGDAHPNPASGDVSIEATIIADDAALGAAIRIVNIQGAPVATFKLTVGENNIEIDTRAWASGTYFYSLLINNRVVITKKLSKM